MTNSFQGLLSICWFIAATCEPDASELFSTENVKKYISTNVTLKVCNMQLYGCDGDDGKFLVCLIGFDKYIYHYSCSTLDADKLTKCKLVSL